MTIFIIILVYVTSFILARWLASRVNMAVLDDLGCIVSLFFILLPPIVCFIILIILVEKEMMQSKFYKWLTNQK